MAKRQKKKTSGERVSWISGDSPNAAEYAVIKEKAKGVNGMKIVLWATIIIGCLSIVVSLGASGVANDALDSVSSDTTAASEEQPGKQAALENVSKWLSGSSSPFPDGTSDLVWDGAIKISESADTSSSSSGSGVKTQLWSHTFSFMDTGENVVRRCSQLVAVSDDGSATPNGTPSLLPSSSVSSSTSVNMSKAPSGYKELDQSSTLSNVIEQWAKAYVGTDSNSLTALVGDPDTSHAYQAAGVGTYAGSSTNWAVWQDVTEDSDAETGRYGAVSVTISFTPYGTDADGNKHSTASTNLTLLVLNPDKGNARVVDWGADGYVKGLKAYQNAVDEQYVTADSSKSDDQTGDGSVDGTTDSTGGNTGDATGASDGATTSDGGAGSDDAGTTDGSADGTVN